jgi:WD40 repeat protein
MALSLILVTLVMVTTSLMSPALSQAEGPKQEERSAITLQTASEVVPLALLSGEEPFLGARFSPDSRLLVTWTGAWLQLWDVAQTEVIASFETATPGVFNANGEWLFFGDAENVQAYQVASGESVTLETGHTDMVMQLASSPAGNLIASSSQDNSVSVWEWQAGESGVQTWAVLAGYDGAADELQFSSDGSLLVSVDAVLNQIRLWRVEQDNSRQVVSDGLQPIKLAPDNRLMAVNEVDNRVVIENVGQVLNEQLETTITTLVGHWGAVQDLVFSPDGTRIATASRDSTISLWDSLTGEELRIFSGHLGPVNQVRLNSDGSLLVSGSADGTIRLWDVQTGDIVKSLESSRGEILELTLSPDETYLASINAGGEAIIWGVGEAIELPDIEGSEETESVESTVTAGIRGMAQEELSAGNHPQQMAGCLIEVGETVLGVARTVNAVQVYAGGQNCEGPVWVATSGQIRWEANRSIDELPLLDIPEQSPLLRIVNYSALCEAASGAGDINGQGPPFTAYPPDSLPGEVQSTLQSGVDVLICHEYTTTPIENCHYLGPGNYSYIYTRLRTDDVIRLVDYTTGGVVAQQKFNGGVPPACPERTARGEVFGDPPPAAEWMPWALGYLYGPGSAVARTVVNTDTLNARRLPDTQAEILAQLPRNTPVNLIGRSADDEWVLALLEDMTQAWLFRELVLVAVQTNVEALPVVEGAAGEILIQVPRGSLR